MHHGDLSGRAAEAQKCDSYPGASRFASGMDTNESSPMTVGGGRVGASFISRPRPIGGPIMRLVGGVASPTIEGVIKQHPSFELLQIVGIHAGEAQ